MDGNQESHDLFRVDSLGNGSFEKTVKGISLLRSFGLNVGIIQTITKDNVPRIMSDAAFFCDKLGLKSWAVNLFGGSSDNHQMASQIISENDSEIIYEKLIDFWVRRNDKDLSIREIDNLLAGLVKKRSSNCSFNGSCGRYFCLDNTGNVYPCDRFSDNPEYLLGNLNIENLAGIVLGNKAKIFRDKVTIVPRKCQSCQWLKSCNNGCTALRDSGNCFVYCKGRVSAYERLSSLLGIAD